MKRRVVIIGGGLAGIAAAVRVVDAGGVPIVIETRKRLGGRATSFVDPRDGAVLDNCQHVLMGCCTNLLDLYDRLGVLELLEWHRTFYWTDGGGRIDRLAACRLPAPLHLSGALRRMQLLDPADRRAIRRAMWRIIRLSPSRRQQWTGRTFLEFLNDCDQTEGAIDRFWRTVIVSACNLDLDRVSAATALHVFQEGFLANRWSYTMGLSRVPLVDLYDPAAALIEQSGGQVQLGASARGIAFDGRRVTGVVTADGAVDGSAVISTVPPDRLDKLVTDALRRADGRLQSLDAFEFSPILGIHLRYASAVMDRPHLTVVDHGVQWLFNKGVDAQGQQHIHAVISAADDWMAMDEAAIVERVTAEIEDIIPSSVGLKPVAARTVKEKLATFAATPDIERRRPTAAPGYVGLGGGGVENLFLAGDWCDTGWPATMEGAVRSGYAAAAAATGQGGVVGDIPPGFLAKMLGLRAPGAGAAHGAA